MKIYYMCVQMKRGVAVLGDSEEGVEPPQKKTKMEEMTFPEKIHTGVTHSYVPTRELLTDSESSLEGEAQEDRQEADRAEPPALEEDSRAKTPDWLVALDSGFRCMGCCRVFPSLEVLQEHVEHGIDEGFSCHAFHLALTWLKSKKSRKGNKRRKKKKIKRMISGSHWEKTWGMRTSSCK
ncbi:protein FAM170A-like [Choloepus didactylus]|uniref:protein FAM170A-like n=1 Tax=Choloepus didactylus TaxID=27675 RepID=UPI00189DF221|nr:protein FAM170A-like [Choloepus didactylus]